jgi:NADPH:quinone reductase-like Zn-dependent oxidoreductase
MASSPDQAAQAGQMQPSTMKGWLHSSAGIPRKVLKFSTDIPIPASVHATDVLVKVSHAALNPGSSIIMQLCPMIFRTKPSIPEMDFSGTVVRTGPKVPVSRELIPGTAIFGSVPVSQHVASGKGALAEVVVVPAESVCLKPDNMPSDQAAGLPTAGVTALALLDCVKLKAGYKVLVNGASGGIGSMVVQMAKNSVGESGRVVGICSGKNLEMVKGLGADEVRLPISFKPVHVC